MGKYDQITQARAMFGIREHETIREIKRKINALLKAHHPDINDGKAEESKEKSISLLHAKKILMNYCENYKISFSKDEVEKNLSPGEFWMKRFGNDPLWSEKSNEK